MTQVLEKWLNDDLKLSIKLNISTFHEDFSDGYLFGEILYRVGRQPDFRLFKHSHDADDKLANFARLGITLHLVGIDISLKDIKHISEGKNRLKTVELLYKLYVQLHRADIEQKYLTSRVNHTATAGDQKNEKLTLQDLKNELIKQEALIAMKQQTVVQKTSSNEQKEEVFQNVSNPADDEVSSAKAATTDNNSPLPYNSYDKTRVARFADRYAKFTKKMHKQQREISRHGSKRATLKQQADEQTTEFEQQYKDIPNYMAAAVAPHNGNKKTTEAVVLPPTRIMNKRMRMVTRLKQFAKAAHDIDVNRKTAQDVHDRIHEFEIQNFARRHLNRKSSPNNASPVDDFGDDRSHHKPTLYNNNNHEDPKLITNDDDDNDNLAHVEPQNRNKTGGVHHQQEQLHAQFSDSPLRFPHYETSVNNRAYIEQIRERVEKDAVVHHEMEHRHHKIWLELARAKREQQHTLHQDDAIEHILQRTSTYRNAANRMLAHRQHKHVEQVHRMAGMRQHANQRNAEYVEVMLREGLWQLPSAAAAISTARPTSSPNGGSSSLKDSIAARTQAYKWCSDAGFSDQAVNMCLPLLSKYAAMAQNAQNALEKADAAEVGVKTEQQEPQLADRNNRKRGASQNDSVEKPIQRRAHTVVSVQSLKSKVLQPQDTSKILINNLPDKNAHVVDKQSVSSSKPQRFSASNEAQVTVKSSPVLVDVKEKTQDLKQSHSGQMQTIQPLSETGKQISPVPPFSAYQPSDHWRHPRLVQYYNILQRWCAAAKHPAKTAASTPDGSRRPSGRSDGLVGTSAAIAAAIESDGSNPQTSSSPPPASCNVTELNLINPLYLAQPRTGEIITGLVNHAYLANNRHVSSQYHKFPRSFLTVLFVAKTYPSRMAVRIAQRLEAKYGLKCIDVNVLMREAVASYALQQEVQALQNDDSSMTNTGNVNQPHGGTSHGPPTTAAYSPNGTILNNNNINFPMVNGGLENTTTRQSKSAHRTSETPALTTANKIQQSPHPNTASSPKYSPPTAAQTTTNFVPTGNTTTQYADQRASGSHLTPPFVSDGLHESRQHHLRSLQRRAEIGRYFVDCLDQHEFEQQKNAQPTTAKIDPQAYVDLIAEAIDRFVVESYRADHRRRLYIAALHATNAATTPADNGVSNNSAVLSPADAPLVVENNNTARNKQQPTAVVGNKAAAPNNSKSAASEAVANKTGAQLSSNSNGTGTNKTSPNAKTTAEYSTPAAHTQPPPALPYADSDFYTGSVIVNFPFFPPANIHECIKKLEADLACIHPSQWLISGAPASSKRSTPVASDKASQNSLQQPETEYEWIELPSRPRCYHKQPRKQLMSSAVDLVATFELDEPAQKYFITPHHGAQQQQQQHSPTLSETIKHMKKERIKAGLPPGTGTAGIVPRFIAVPPTTVADTAVNEATTPNETASPQNEQESRASDNNQQTSAVPNQTVTFGDGVLPASVGDQQPVLPPTALPENQPVKDMVVNTDTTGATLPPKNRDLAFYVNLFQTVFNVKAVENEPEEKESDSAPLARKLQTFYRSQFDAAGVNLIILEKLSDIKQFHEQLKTLIRRRIDRKWTDQRTQLAFIHYCHTTAAACAQQLWLCQTQARKHMLLPYLIRINGAQALEYLRQNDTKLCANLQRTIEAKLIRRIKMCLNGCYGDYVHATGSDGAPSSASGNNNNKSEKSPLTHEPFVVQLRYTLHQRSSSGVVNVLAGESVQVPTTTVRVVIKSVGRQLLHRSLMMDTLRLPERLASTLSFAWARSEERLLKDVTEELERSDEIGQAFQTELERIQTINAFVCSRRNTVLTDTFRDWTATYNAFILPALADEGFGGDAEEDGVVKTDVSATSSDNDTSRSVTSGNVSGNEAHTKSSNKNDGPDGDSKKSINMPKKKIASAKSDRRKTATVHSKFSNMKPTAGLEKVSTDKRTFLADLNVLRDRCVESCDWRREECFRTLLELMRDEQQFNHILYRLFNHGLRLVQAELRYFTRILRFLFVYFKQLFSVASTEYRALATTTGMPNALPETLPAEASRVNFSSIEKTESPQASITAISAAAETQANILNSTKSKFERIDNGNCTAQWENDNICMSIVREIVDTQYPLFNLLMFHDAYDANRSVDDFIFAENGGGKRFSDVTRCTAEQLTQSLGRQEDQMRYLRLVDDDFWPVIVGVNEYEGLRLMTRMRAELVEYFHTTIATLLTSDGKSNKINEEKIGNQDVPLEDETPHFLGKNPTNNPNSSSTTTAKNLYVGQPPEINVYADASANHNNKLHHQRQHYHPLSELTESEASIPQRANALITPTSRHARVNIPRQLLLQAVGLDVSPCGRLFAASRQSDSPTNNAGDIMENFATSEGNKVDETDHNSKAQTATADPIRSTVDAVKLYRLSQSLANRFMRVASSELRATRGRVKAVRGETSRVCESFKACIRQFFFELDRQVEQVYVDEIHACDRFFTTAVEALNSVQPLPENLSPI